MQAGVLFTLALSLARLGGEREKERERERKREREREMRYDRDSNVLYCTVLYCTVGPFVHGFGGNSEYHCAFHGRSMMASLCLPPPILALTFTVWQGQLQGRETEYAPHSLRTICACQQDALLLATTMFLLVNLG